MRKKPLSDQIIVVTGASSGLGRAIARAAGERGAKVVVTARNAEALENCVAEIERAGSEALAVPADCAEREHVERVVERAVERFGRIDTYVANAIVTVYSEGRAARAQRPAAGNGRELLRRRLARATGFCVAPAGRASTPASRNRSPSPTTVRYPAWRPRSPRQVRRSVTWLHGLDTAPPAAPEGLTAVASMTLEWHCSN